MWDAEEKFISRSKILPVEVENVWETFWPFERERGMRNLWHVFKAYKIAFCNIGYDVINNNVRNVVFFVDNIL